MFGMRFVPVVLCFGLLDLFIKKIKEVPLSRVFPDYTGPDEEKPAIQFIQNKFVALQKSKDHQKAIYAHVTTATGYIKYFYLFFF